MTQPRSHCQHPGSHHLTPLHTEGMASSSVTVFVSWPPSLAWDSVQSWGISHLLNK